ncbi:hypothetical protein CC2G_009905 [Coprinopsis cinerea AmutBmut pab1-1]|nr:hypothetical protein CC2G_009905 [Coprinopsis cinerea AmutBmut pab1-1]
MAVREVGSEPSKVSLLPPEVLSRIFIIYAQMCFFPRDLAYYHYVPVPEWLRVTHVSRYWRETALGCAQLWCNINTSYRRWARIMFERSKRAPLSFLYSSEHRPEDQLAADILAQSERLKNLTIITISTPPFLQQGLEQHSSPAPLLENLIMKSRDLEYRSLLPRLYTLPSTHFGGEAPRLRHVNFEFYHLPWDSTLYRGLTFLRLSHRGTRPPTPDPEVFFAAIAAMKELRVLVLDTALPVLPPRTHRVIPLPHLQTLTLRVPYRECQNFLKHIALPITAILDLVCFPSSVSDTDSDSPLVASELGQALSASWLEGPIAPPDPDTPKALRAIWFHREQDSRTPHIKIVADVEPEFPDFISCRRSSSLSLDLLSRTSTQYHALLSSIPLNHLQTLQLDATKIDTNTLEYLAGLPALENVTIAQLTAADFYRCIHSDPSSSQNRPTRDHRIHHRQHKSRASQRSRRSFASESISRAPSRLTRLWIS